MDSQGENCSRAVREPPLQGPAFTGMTGLRDMNIYAAFESRASPTSEPFLLPNSNSVGLYQEQLAFVAWHPWIRYKIIHEPSNYCWNHLGVISDLQGDDPFVLGWWIRRDVGKVAVQRNQNGIQLLRLRDDNCIIGILWDMFL